MRAIFGFQDNNVKNQLEHLTLLLTNYKEQLETPAPVPVYIPVEKASKKRPEDRLPTNPNDAAAQAVKKLHARLFDNYTKWCRYLHVKPAFSTTEPLADLVLFFLLWGEAGNFRQTPELLCFLFHSLSATAHQPSSTPMEPGTFLATVIRPIYDEVKMDNEKKTPLGERAPHKDIRNYDDFNEFFWTKKCLQFDAYNIRDALGARDTNRNPKTAKKTFIETRSWMRALWSFRRIFVLNFVLFCATVGFAVNMVLLCPESPIMYGPDLGKELELFGKYYYNPKARFNYLNDASSTTTGPCNLPKLSTCLGVSNFVLGQTFSIIPQDFKMLMADVPFQPCVELLSGRCACYLETLDKCFSQVGTGKALVADITTGNTRDYKIVTYNQSKCMPAWKKAAYAVINDAGPGLLNCGLCNVPTVELPTRLPKLLGKMVDTTRTDMGPMVFGGGVGLVGLFLVGDILNRVVSAMSTGFVGRKMPVPCCGFVRYSCFWMVLLIVKLYFDYTFMVKNLVETSLMMWLSDSTKYLQASNFMLQATFHNIVYIAFLWLPAFIVFMYDAQIFYALFSVVVGSIRGFNLRIGELRSFRILRLAFKDIPRMFNYKLVENAMEAKAFQQAIESKKHKTSRHGTCDVGPTLRIQTTAYSSTAHDDDTEDGSSTSRSNSTASSRYFGSVTGVDGDEYLRVIPFAMAWNRCLSSMREADVLSNRELGVLSYLIEGNCKDEATRRLYPPAFLTAGKLDESLDIIAECGQVYKRLLTDKKSDAALSKVEKSMHSRVKKDSLRVEACLGSFKFTVRVVQLLLGDAHADIDPCFAFMEESVVNKTALKALHVSNLYAVRSASADLMKAILDVPKGSRDDSLHFQRALYRVIDSAEQLLGQLKKLLSKQDNLVAILNATALKPNSFFIAPESSQQYATIQIQTVI
ncbi:hypothetical protein DYB32_008842, partial [Aphanomyces invadans]